MTTQQLIAGLLDIQTGRIPTDCILDMVPYLVGQLTKAKVIEETLLTHNTEKDYVALSSFRMIKALVDLDPEDAHFYRGIEAEVNKNYGKAINPAVNQ